MRDRRLAMLLVVLAVAAPHAAAKVAWGGYRGDLGQQGTLNDPGEVRWATWRTWSPCSDDCSPILVDGTVIVLAFDSPVQGERSATLHGFDVMTGIERWSRRVQAGGLAFAEPAFASDGRLVVWGDATILEAFEARNGSVAWRAEGGWPRAVTAGNVLVFRPNPAEDGLTDIEAVRLTDGATAWVFRPSGFRGQGQSKQALQAHDDLVWYAGSSLFAIDAATGAERFQASGPYGVPLTRLGNHAITLSQSPPGAGRLDAFRPSDGQRVAQLAVGNVHAWSWLLASSGDTAYFAARLGLEEASRLWSFGLAPEPPLGGLPVLAPAEMVLHWTADLDGYYPEVVETNGPLVLVQTDAGLQALRAQDGTLLWKALYASQPILTASAIIVADSDGLYTLDPATGQPFEAKPEPAESPFPIPGAGPLASFGALTIALALRCAFRRSSG